MTARAGSPRPFFLEGGAGPLFAVHFPPAGAAAAPHLVHVPAFAEEANKARRMVAEQSRALAAAGIGVLLVDPYGTGDSGGDFGDARWSLWKEDLARSVDWLRRQGHGPVGLWGLRLGALLALDALASLIVLDGPMLLWQPVPAGKTFLTQFLRLRVAAAMMGRGEKETTKELVERLRGGQTVEVAGYELASELVLPMESCSMKDLDLSAVRSMLWLDVAAAGPDGQVALSPASERVVGELSPRVPGLEAAAVPGEAFWSTVEITAAPELIRETTRRLAGAGPWAGVAGEGGA